MTTYFSMFVPELHQGEHIARAHIFARGQSHEQLMEAAKLLAFNLANNLMEDDSIDREQFVNIFYRSRLLNPLTLEKLGLTNDLVITAVSEKVFDVAITLSSLAAKELVRMLLLCGVRAEGCHLEKHIRAANISLEMVQILVDAGSPLSHDLVESLVRRKPGVNGDLSEEMKVLRLILQKLGLEPTPRCLLLAAHTGNLVAIDLLLQQGVDISHTYRDSRQGIEISFLTCGAGTTPNGFISHEDHLDDNSRVNVVRYLIPLLEKVSRPSLRKAIFANALIISAYHGANQIVSVLCNAGADPNGENVYGRSPLTAAVWKRQADTCKLLIRLGAHLDIDPSSSMWATALSPLQIAAFLELPEILETLIGAGANVEFPRDEVRLYEWKRRQKTCRHLEYSCWPIKDYHRDWSPLKLATVAITWEHRCFQKLQNRADVSELRLADVVRTRHYDSIRLFLNKGLNLEQRDHEGNSPLEVAISNNDSKAATMLLDAGAQASQCSAFSFSKAIYQFSDDLVLRLFRGGAPTNQSHISDAIGNCGWAVVSEMVTSRASIRQYCADYGSVLQEAFWNDRIEVVDNIMAADSTLYDARAMPSSVLHAIRTSCLVRASKLLDRRPNGPVSAWEATSVAIAAFFKQRALLDVLLPIFRHSPDVPCMIDDSFLCKDSSFMLWNDYVYNIVWKTNFDTRWDYPPFRCSPLFPAVKGGDEGTIAILLAHGYRPDALAMYSSMVSGSATLLETLIRHGGNVNTRLHGKESLLQYAVRVESVEFVRILVNHGANVHARPGKPIFEYECENEEERDNRTALQRAFEKGNLAIVDILLRAGADVNEEPANSIGGATSLQIVAANGFLGLARYLLERGADINAPPGPNFGGTALQAAAKTGRIDMIQYLLDHGAKTTGRYRIQYIMAVSIAIRSGHDAAAEILQNHRELTREEVDLLKTMRDDIKWWDRPSWYWDDSLSCSSSTSGDGDTSDSFDCSNGSASGEVEHGGDYVEQNAENTDHTDQSMAGDEEPELEISNLNEHPRDIINMLDANGGDDSQEEVRDGALIDRHLTGSSDVNMAGLSSQASRSAQVGSLTHNLTARPILGEAWVDAFFDFDLYSH
jgi:ankyrin repeat protein